MNDDNDPKIVPVGEGREVRANEIVDRDPPPPPPPPPPSDN